MRRFAMLLPLALLVAACAAETVTPLTTTPVQVEESSTTTTVTVVTTTSTARPESMTAEGPRSLCEGRSSVLAVGAEYRVGCFVTPFGLAGLGAGWRMLESDDDSVTVTWEGLGEEVVVAMLAYASAGDGETVLGRVLEKDRLMQVSEVASLTVDGWSGQWVDVEGAEVRSPPVCPLTRPVIGKGGFIHTLVGPGDSVVTAQGYGVGACQVVRIVIVELRGQTLMLLAGTERPEAHVIAAAAMETFLDSITFEVP